MSRISSSRKSVFSSPTCFMHSRRMRSTRALRWSTIVCVAAASTKALAATYYVTSGSTVSTSPVDLFQAANYTTDVAPGTGDVLDISTANVSTGANYFTFSGTPSIGQLRIDLASGNVSGGSETITSANTLTLNDIGAPGVTTGGILLNSSAGASLILNENVQLASTQFFTSLRTLTIGGNVNLNGFNLYTDAVSSTTTISGSISDSTGNLTTGITASGAGNLVLSGSNTYAGGTMLGTGGGATGGYVRVMNNSALGTGPVTFAGSYYIGTNIGGSAITLGNAITVNSGVTATFDGGYYPITLNGNITGAGTVATTSTGMVTFSGTNSYTGGTNVTNGFAIFNSSSAVPTSGKITISSGASLAEPFTTVNSILTSGLITNTSAGSIAIPAGTTNTETLNFFSNGFTALGLSSTGTATYGGALTPAGNGYDFGGDAPSNLTVTTLLTGANTLSKTGSGILNLSGTNSYTGLTTVSSGTLIISPTGSFTGYTGGITASSGTTLNVSSGTINAGSGAITAGGAAVYVSGSLTTTGAIGFGNPGGGTLTVGSGGTLSVGTQSNSYHTNFVINGTYNVSGAATMAVASTNLVSGTGTFDMGSLTVSNATSVTDTVSTMNIAAALGLNSGGTFNVGSGATLNAGSVSVPYGNPVNLIVAGSMNVAGNFGFSAPNSTVTVGSGSTLTIGGTWSSGYPANYTINGVINTNNTNGSTVSCGGTELWTGTGTYNTDYYGIGNYSTVYSTVNINDTGYFLTQNAGPGSLQQSAGTINATSSGAGTIRLGHYANTTGYLSYFTLTGTAVFNAVNSATILGWDGTGILNISGGTANLQGLSYSIAGHGGSGYLNLISGNLNIGSGGIFVGGSPALTVFNLSGGTLGTIPGASGWATSLPMTATTGTTSQLNTSGGSFSLNGNISGGGSITVAGANVLTLGGTNSYTGATSVTGTGKLYVKGSLNQSSAVTVASGATLGGIGAINGTTSISSGGILEAGQLGVGSLTLGSLSIPGTATINIGTLAGYATTPAFNVSGVGAYDPGTSTGGITINVASLTGASAGTYELLQYNGSNADNQTLTQYTLTSLPSRTTGSLSDVYNAGTGIGYIDLTIGSSGSAYIIWTGATNSLWDTNTSNVNWNLSTGGTTTFQTGDQVVFQDGPANTTLNIDAANISVSSMTFNNNTSTYSITGAYGIGGATGLTMNGTGTVVVATSNTFTGAVAVNAGVLSLQNSGAAGASSGVSVASGATLQLSGGITAGVGVPLSIGGPGATGQSGSLVNAAGNNIYGGPLTLTGSTTFSVLAGGMNLSNSALINGTGANLTLTGAAGTNGVLAGGLNTGTGTVTKTGLGTWTLSGANNETGLTNVTSGTLVVSGSMPAGNSFVVLQGATLDLGYSTGGGYTGSIIVNGSGLGNTSQGVFFKPGVEFQTNYGLDLQNLPTTVGTYGGAGIASLGGFDINSGAFLYSAASASGSVIASTIDLATNSYGFGVSVTAGANTSTGDLTVAGAVTGSGAANSYTYAGPNNFYAGFVKIGNGSLLLTGTSTYTSGTEVTNGSLMLGVSNALPATAMLQLGLNSTSAQLLLDGVSQTVTGLLTAGTGTANAVMGNSTTLSTLTINYNVSGGTDTFAGNLGGTTANQSNLALVTKGVGTIVFSGVSNTYSGGTTVNAGTLTSTVTGGFGTGNLLINPTGTAGNSNDTATVNTTNSLAITSNVTVNTNSPTAIGTLCFNGAVEQIGSLAGTGAVVLNDGPGVAFTVGNNFNTTFSGNITDPSNVSSLTKIGNGILTLGGTNSWGGPTNVSAGTLVIRQTSALPTGGSNSSVFINTGATLVLDSQTTESNIPSLNLNGTMIVHGGNLVTINSAVGAAYNNAWASTGSGLYSSAAATDSTYLTALGVIQNDNGTGSGIALYSIYEGQSVSDSDILVKYTYYGDTNLDGKIDGSDYSRVDNAYGMENVSNGIVTTPVSGWFNGDFNYDGVVDGSDYTLMDNAFNNQGAQFSASVATPTALIGGGSTTGSAVPEPATLSLLGIGAIGLLGRRRRQR